MDRTTSSTRSNYASKAQATTTGSPSGGRLAALLKAKQMPISEDGDDGDLALDFSDTDLRAFGSAMRTNIFQLSKEIKAVRAEQEQAIDGVGRLIENVAKAMTVAVQKAEDRIRQEVAASLREAEQKRSEAFQMTQMAARAGGHGKDLSEADSQELFGMLSTTTSLLETMQVRLAQLEASDFGGRLSALEASLSLSSEKNETKDEEADNSIWSEALRSTLTLSSKKSTDYETSSVMSRESRHSGMQDHAQAPRRFAPSRDPSQGPSLSAQGYSFHPQTEPGRGHGGEAAPSTLNGGLNRSPIMSRASSPPAALPAGPGACGDYQGRGRNTSTLTSTAPRQEPPRQNYVPASVPQSRQRSPDMLASPQYEPRIGRPSHVAHERTQEPVMLPVNQVGRSTSTVTQYAPGAPRAQTTFGQPVPSNANRRIGGFPNRAI